MMTIDDMERIAALPSDPAAPEFDAAVRAVAADMAEAAFDNKGLRAALSDATQLVMVAIALGTDRPRATLHMLIAELTEQAENLLSEVGHVRPDA